MFEQDMHRVTIKKRIYIYKHYILFATLSKQKNIIKNVKGLFNKLAVLVLYIPGKIATKLRIKDNK